MEHAAVAAALLALAYRSAKSLSSPVLVAIDRLEDALASSAPAAGGAGPKRRRRQTMTAAQAAHASAGAARAATELLQGWALLGGLTCALGLGLPYARELRALLLAALVLLPRAPRAALLQPLFRCAGVPLGRAVPATLRWGKRQARAALGWWVSPVLRGAAAALVPPVALGMLGDAQLLRLRAQAQLCARALEAPAAAHPPRVRVAGALGDLPLDLSDDDDEGGDGGAGGGGGAPRWRRQGADAAAGGAGAALERVASRVSGIFLRRAAGPSQLQLQ